MPTDRNRVDLRDRDGVALTDHHVPVLNPDEDNPAFLKLHIITCQLRNQCNWFTYLAMGNPPRRQQPLVAPAAAVDANADGYGHVYGRGCGHDIQVICLPSGDVPIFNYLFNQKLSNNNSLSTIGYIQRFRRHKSLSANKTVKIRLENVLRHFSLRFFTTH